MPTVILAGSIRQHAGGLGAVEVEARSVRVAIAALEAAYPALRGWVVDEQGMLRRHVKVFHRGVSVSLDAPLAPEDELHIVAAISGG
jgi:molybdopterin converting factor small subunit